MSARRPDDVARLRDAPGRLLRPRPGRGGAARPLRPPAAARRDLRRVPGAGRALRRRRRHLPRARPPRAARTPAGGVTSRACRIFNRWRWDQRHQRRAAVPLLARLPPAASTLRPTARSARSACCSAGRLAGRVAPPFVTASPRAPVNRPTALAPALLIAASVLERTLFPAALRLALCALVLTAGGCSYVFVDGPPKNHAQMPYFQCSSSKAWPVLDSVLAASLAIGTGGAIADGGSSQDTTGAVIVAAEAAAFALSALGGFQKVEACQEAVGRAHRPRRSGAAIRRGAPASAPHPPIPGSTRRPACSRRG